jgi:hypothetical protein
VLLEGKVGPAILADGSERGIRLTRTGALAETDVHARYMEAVLRGNCYKLVVTGAAATAFTGGAGGTPLCSIYNPVGSGKYGVLLAVGIASRVVASAAGTVGFNLWGGVSAANTGTATTPTNLLTLQTGGSVMVGSSNAATTSTTAVALVLPLGSFYQTATATALTYNALIDVAGIVVCQPGNLIALGATAALTSATYDVSMVWEEVPI